MQSTTQREERFDYWLTSNGVCEVLGDISFQTLWRWTKAGIVPPPDVIIGRRKLWKASTIEAAKARIETAGRA